MAACPPPPIVVSHRSWQCCRAPSPYPHWLAHTWSIQRTQQTALHCRPAKGCAGIKPQLLNCQHRMSRRRQMPSHHASHRHMYRGLCNHESLVVGMNSVHLRDCMAWPNATGPHCPAGNLLHRAQCSGVGLGRAPSGILLAASCCSVDETFPASLCKSITHLQEGVLHRPTVGGPAATPSPWLTCSAQCTHACLLRS